MSTIVATSASADPVASKRAEAARIAAQLERLAERVSMLTEDYNEARVKANDLDSRTRNAEAQLAAMTAKAQATTDSLKQMSLQAYMKGGFEKAAQLGNTDPARARFFVNSAANRQKDALDSARAAKAQLAEQQSSLISARDQARRNLANLNAKRKAAAAAEAEQRALLSRVKGELANLVAAEQSRRSAAARPSRNKPRPNLGTPPGVDAPAPNPGAAAAVAEAKKQLGKPYKWGGSGPDNFDCSGLTSWAWRVGAGRSLPHSSRAQYAATSRVALADIKPGDLTFYGSSVGSIHHVGIYAGGGYMVDAPETGRNVQYVYAFRKDLVGIGRVN